MTRRKYFLVAVSLTLFLAAVGVSVGFALSLDGVSETRDPGMTLLSQLPDSVKLFGMGSLFLAAAAAIRRTVESYPAFFLTAQRAYNRDVTVR